MTPRPRSPTADLPRQRAARYNQVVSPASEELPSRARVVVVGGGVVGCSVAYHLTKRGVNDVVLLERKSLTSGTTWHAAGLITEARPTAGTRAIVGHSLEVFRNLEAETGLGTGFRRTGTLHLAMNDARWEELLRQATVHRSDDREIEVLDADGAVALFPPLSPDGIRGALHYPADGRGNATDTTMALAKGARMGGARIFEQTTVTDVVVRGDRVVGVGTDRGDIEAEVVVNCTGMWGREFGARAGVRLPLQALAHYYVVTEDIPGLPADMPTIKSSDDWSYVKDDAGKLMVGFFEPGSEPWMSRGIPQDVEYATLPENWDHLGDFYAQMVERIPLLADAGVRLFFCGPESFTPDGLYYLGEVPELTNYFAACGFNSVGFLSGPGAGKVLADWIVDGRPPMDVPELDPRRVVPFQVNRRYLEGRVVETLDLAYAMHWPYQQKQTMRGIRVSPLHDDMERAGAVFGEVAGWERANWFAPAGTPREYDHAYGRAAWFEHWAAEHRAVREDVGLFDLSSFGKIRVQGRDAVHLLQELSTADVDVAHDRTVYTQWLNDRGGIEADVTVTRVADDDFLVLTAAATLGREMDRLRKHIGDRFVTVADVSAGLGDAVGHGSAVPRAAAAAHRRRPVARGVPVRGVPRDRPRRDVRPRDAVDVRRRARVGAAGAGRPGATRVPDDRISRCRRRPAACRLPRPELAAPGEGVPQLGSRHRVAGHPAGSGAGVHRRLGHAVHRTGRPARPARGRRPPTARAAEVRRPGRRRLSRRAHLPGRRPGRHGDVGEPGVDGGGVRLARVRQRRHPRHRRRPGVDRGGKLRDRGGRGAPPGHRLVAAALRPDVRAGALLTRLVTARLA